MKKTIKIILLILITLLLSIGIAFGISYNLANVTLTEKTTKTSSVANINANMSYGSLGGYSMDLNTLLSTGKFCAAKGDPLVKRASRGGIGLPDKTGGRREVIEYAEESISNIPESIAYATWQNASTLEKQYLVWDSWQWSQKGYGSKCIKYTSETYGYHFTINESGDIGSDSSYDDNDASQSSSTESTVSAVVNNTMGAGASSATIGRAEQFANFEHLLLSNSNTLNITSPTSSDNVKIIVDQSAQTYTFGPYTIEFPNYRQNTLNGETTLGNLLYKEIIGTNAGESTSNQFCKASFEAEIQFQNGSSTVQTKIANPCNTGLSKELIIVDASGSESTYAKGFPEFGKEFYIRYRVADTNRVITKITPKIEVKYVNKFNQSATLYKSTGAKMIEHFTTYVDSFVEATGLEKYGHGIWQESTKWENYVNYPGMESRYITGVTDSEKSTSSPTPTGQSVTSQFDRGHMEPNGFVSGKATVSNNPPVASKSGTWDEPNVPDGKDAKGKPKTKTVTHSYTYTYYQYQDDQNTSWKTALYYSISGDKDPDNPPDGTEGTDAKAKQEAYDHIDPLYKAAIRVKADNPVVTETVNKESGYQWQLKTNSVSKTETQKTFTFASKEVHMYLGGNVWGTEPDTKTGNGIKTDSSKDGAGVEVSLLDQNNGDKDTIMTDSDGDYGFKNINPLHKYKVQFRYNGMQYIEADTGTNSISDSVDPRKTANETNRDEINNRFSTISAANDSYGSDKKAFGYYAKIKANSNGDYKSWNAEVETGATNAGALRYCDALYALKKICQDGKNYDRTSRPTMESSYANAFEGLLENYESKQGSLEGALNATESSLVWQYMMDTLVTSLTPNSYPAENRFVLADVGDSGDSHNAVTALGANSVYRADQDEARHVDYGITFREVSDLALQKDAYKATVLVNGKNHEYYYNKKNANSDSDTWEIEARASNALYNGEQSYGREIRRSEYLYDANTVGQESVKNLQVFVTYKITIKNQGVVKTSVNEIVDYYDTEYYQYVASSKITQNNTYLGSDGKGTKSGTIGVQSGSSCSGSKTNVGPYTSIYITPQQQSQELNPGELMYAYITFKVQTDPNTGRIKLNEDLSNGKLKTGDRNIAEINKYSTSNNDKKGKGLVDVDSIAGDLTRRDLRENGDIIASSNPVENRLEDDIDKAPNVIVYIPLNEKETELKGYTFEDARTNTSDGSVIGNGLYDANKDKDKTINGVTVQLVELVQQVDQDGLPTGNYTKEHIWSTITYSYTQENGIDKINDAIPPSIIDETRYYSGNGKAKIILTGSDGILKIRDENLDNKGTYAFKSVPSGDFFIRFIYGDTTQTTLTSDTSNEVNKLLASSTADTTTDNSNIKMNDTNNGLVSEEESYMSNVGLNTKSYNGQDYKSTVYQSGLSQNTAFNGVSGNGISGYNDYDKQNYTNLDGITKNAGTDKSSMYYYDIAEGDKAANVSDAKDVYAFRKNCNNYSTGANGYSLLNNRAEVLDSFEKIQTYQYTKKASNGNTISDVDSQVLAQKKLIQELMKNTRMVAQSGVINMEVEYNSKVTNNDGVQNSENQATENLLHDKAEIGQTQSNSQLLNYVIDNINLGLVERPEAQLKLTKQVTNFKIMLANGETLFDTNQSVNNLYYAKHTGHDVRYDNGESLKGPDSYPDSLKLDPTGFRLSYQKVSSNSQETPELLQAYMDDELMEGAKLTVQYKLTVDNVGEIDYLDNQFYYTGKTNNKNIANISRTNANTVIDYVTNMIKYDKNYQDDGTNWTIKTSGTIYNTNSVEDDFVNREYSDLISTYNEMLTTDKLSKVASSEGDNKLGLLPNCINKTELKGDTSISTTLVLSTLLSSNNSANNLVYNNLSEIVETNNSQGRRMEYSISGNQKMSDQSLGENAATTVTTSIDLVTPTEIDTDSAQKILILPPTGADKNINEKIIIILASLIIIITGIVTTKSVLTIKKYK